MSPSSFSPTYLKWVDHPPVPLLGGVPSKSDESPLKGDTPLLINQGCINPKLTLTWLWKPKQRSPTVTTLTFLGAGSDARNLHLSMGLTWKPKKLLLQGIRECTPFGALCSRSPPDWFREVSWTLAPKQRGNDLLWFSKGAPTQALHVCCCLPFFLRR